ncbi:MAG: Oligopeptide ABC superfamily ATP binding cassette transporter, binding protein [uncultured bacterium]|nr:MAG: Oligopeptide ABC superfamily ATP binding cassette transporter, binding protein [uncultured bacterium]
MRFARYLCLCVAIVTWAEVYASIVWATDSKQPQKIYRRIALDDPLNMDLAQLEGVFDVHLMFQLGEGLLAYKAGIIVPAIATDWTVSKDLTEYTFSIDPQAMFSDGTYIQAADVLNLFKYHLSNDSLINSELMNIKGAKEFKEKRDSSISGIVVISPWKIKIQLIKPSLIFLKLLASEQCFILPHSSLLVLKSSKIAPFVSSGPYVLLSYVRNEQIVLVKNKHYRKNMDVYYDAISYDIISDVEGAINKYLYEDYYNDIIPIYVPSVPKELADKYRKIDVISPKITYLQFNVTRAAVKNDSLRKLLAVNLDVSGYLHELSLPDYYKTNFYIPRGMLGYKERVYSDTYFVNESEKELLSKSGCGKPHVCTIELKYEKRHTKSLERLFHPLQKYKGIIEVKLSQEPRVPWYHNFITQNYDAIYLSNSSATYLDTYAFMINLNSDKYWPGIIRKNISQLLNNSQKTSDRSLLSEIYSKIDEDMCSQYIVLPLYQGDVPHYYVRNDIAGYPTPISTVDVIQVKELKPMKIVEK